VGARFCPDYLGLGAAIEALGHPRTLALTATASTEVRDEIVSRLGIRNPKILVQGFDRPNIYLRVDRFKTRDEKREALLHRVLWADKPGIVYASARKTAEQIMGDLSEQGVNALFYHGGLGGKERESIQERFMNGAADAIVATNAFGLGVDKPNVRFVYHYDVPESLISYYQEIGRAGRDGERSEAILFYRRQDIGAQRFKMGEGRLDPETLEGVARRIADAEQPVAIDSVASEAGLSQRKLTAAVHRLADAGAIETLPNGRVAAVAPADLRAAALRAAEQQDEVRERKLRRLDEMRDYAESAVCRRERLLARMGEEFHGPCGFCDKCEGSAARATAGAGGVRREVV
jgi:ATP-dependent DNA helicase RecQ